MAIVRMIHAVAVMSLIVPACVSDVDGPESATEQAASDSVLPAPEAKGDINTDDRESNDLVEADATAVAAPEALSILEQCMLAGLTTPSREYWCSRRVKGLTQKALCWAVVLEPLPVWEGYCLARYG